MSKSKNPVAIITGGSRGVGKATALLLASKGWNVTLTCTSSLKDALKVTQQCIELGVEAQAISADVGDIDACKETVNETLARWAR
ncbi:MAG: SDR family NAD(P)-dependent oxidoreductase, partial [Porticoccaceae bacterium]|nr:SDR family NAD(P)-dependent oxidoreductase [Porticoccaceae bacterium]